MELTKVKKPNRSFLRLLLEYVSVAGSVFFILTFALNVNWKEAASILTSVTGQAVCVAFGAVAIVCLWLVGKVRTDDESR